ncbi:MAG: GTP 3',8-cyclase MoaA [Eubacterium sp.]|nr:GTP 3',8-cyclase MoaA [Lachnospiraceae bacterium]MBQ9322135.1 GTP 3',8-cyclase MoaA [Eubacterium sp.]
MKDNYGREIDYLRISITDRCNLRCRYCMPDGIDLIPIKDILTYEEILETAEAAASLGIRTIKITGGEPLVRRGCPGLIRALKQISGIDTVTLTTNGVYLKDYLGELLDAGLDAVNVSLDTCDPQKFHEITGFDRLPAVMEGISAAIEAGIRTKINTVLIRGFNEDGWKELTLLAKDRPLDVRFIEMMPIGEGRAYAVVSNEEMQSRIEESFGKGTPETGRHGYGPAVYIRLQGFQGCIGFISAIHQKFCASCNRIRLTSEGRLKGCLCYGSSDDLRKILRSGRTDRAELLKNAIADSIRNKPEAHCFENMEAVRDAEQHRMIAIGG